MSFSTSFFLMNSNGMKSLSIRSMITISSLFTNLLNSDINLLVVFIISFRSFFICWLSSFISLSSFSTSWRDEMRFLPRRRTRSLMSLFRSSMSLRRVLKSVSRNWVWLSVACCSMIFYGLWVYNFLVYIYFNIWFVFVWHDV